MHAIAIRIENLGKQYRIGERERYHSLRESFMRAMRSSKQLLSGAFTSRRQELVESKRQSTFWALRDVSVEIKTGEVVGIIGRNGAGKSTLLKILSRITEPTTGRVELRGRVGSLLEVGTGFHPELTGRENIYLNGAILGMRRHEIQRKFDDIVEFAEIEHFLDTPVKHYSSGMHMRLAFSVAAHLEPEILLIDEVLAVGDALFQKKCLNKMQDRAHEGRTVLFVSHDVRAITRLCPKTILIESGSVRRYGDSHEVVRDYLHGETGTSARRVWPDLDKAPGNDIVRLCSASIRTEEGRVAEMMDIRRPVGIEVEYKVRQGGVVLVPNFHVYNAEGTCVFCVIDQDPEWKQRPRPAGRFVTTAWIPGNYLAEGTFLVMIYISTFTPSVVHCWEPDAVAFHVVDSVEGDSARSDYAGPMPGVVRPLVPWTTQYQP